MEGRIGSTWVEKMVVLFALLFCQMPDVKGNYNRIARENDISSIKWTIQYVKQNIRSLMDSPDPTYEEKTNLNEYEDALVKLESNFSKVKANMEENSIENIKHETAVMKDEMEVIKNNIEPRMKLRLAEECVQEVKKANYREAITKLYLINDNATLKSIIKKIYNGSKDNFNSIRDLGYEIPSISLSFQVFKLLKKEVDEYDHFDNNIGLSLIESVKKSIIDQYAADEFTKSEATNLLEETKIPVSNWIVDMLGQAINDEKANEELFEISERITYEINDGQFFRQIAHLVARRYYTDVTNDTFLIKMSHVFRSGMRSVPQIYFYNELFEKIYGQSGLDPFAIGRITFLQNSMKVANMNEVREFKSSTNELYKTTFNIKNALIRTFKFLLLNEIYDRSYGDYLARALYVADPVFCEEVIKTAVSDVYRKMDTKRIIELFRDSTVMEPSIIGYEVVFDLINEKNVSINDVRNVGALLKLQHVVTETLQFELIYSIDLHILKKLKRIQSSQNNLRAIVSAMFNSAVRAGNYTSDEYQILSKQVFAHFGFFIETLVYKLYPNVSAEKLIHYMISLPTLEERIVGLFVLNNIIPKNNASLFTVAENCKLMTLNQEYGSVQGIFRTQVLRHRNSLPYSIRNAVFAKEVYIKNSNWGGEYLLIKNEKIRKAYTQVTWRTGNRTKFLLEYSGKESVYKIKNEENEFLFASGDEFTSNSRWVVSQVGGNRTDRDYWRLIPSNSNRTVHIINEFYKEYLFAGNQTKDRNRPIFTWTTGGETSNSKWAIEDATDYSIDD